MEFIEKYNEAKEYFEKVSPTLKQKKIKKVCSFNSSYNTHSKRIIYSIDNPLYIIFEDNTSLIVEYYFVSELRIEYRNLTNEEIEETEKLEDMFNVEHEIHNYKTYELSHIDTIELEYGYINEIEINKFAHEYEAWVDHYITLLPASDETFDEIAFVMNNGKAICICPEDAEADGYLDVWAEGSNENFKKIQQY